VTSGTVLDNSDRKPIPGAGPPLIGAVVRLLSHDTTVAYFGAILYRGPKEVPKDVWSPWLMEPCVAIQIWTDLNWRPGCSTRS
jgi:hypothetical protein